MDQGSTLTIRLPVETKAQLAKLSQYTQRQESLLGADAIADYVDRELAIIDAIERGRSEVRLGRVIPHEDVASEARAIIEAARVRR